MPRLLLLLLAAGLAASGCDAFNAKRGTYTATVRGDERFDLRGSAYLGGRVSDEPPVASILLTGLNQPAIEVLVPAAGFRAARYPVPAEARATFELDRYDGAPYVGTSGFVELASVSATRAVGTFSFTAERDGQAVTVEGSFVAEAD